MSKSKKIVPIAGVVLAIVVIAVVISCMVIYINADAIRFDYVDCNVYVADGSVYPEENGYSIRYPFFGNSAMLGEFGASYGFPLGAGEKNVEVYQTVNDPIYVWARVTVAKYENRVNIGYTVENDGRTLTVELSGTANDGENTVPVEKVFVFDIENASPDNLPVWTNRTETDDEFYFV